MEYLEYCLKKIDYNQYKVAEILFDTPLINSYCATKNIFDMRELMNNISSNYQINYLLRQTNEYKYPYYEMSGLIYRLYFYFDEKGDINAIDITHEAMPIYKSPMPF